VLRPVPVLWLVVTLNDESQVPLLRTENIDDPSGASGRIEPGVYRSTVTLPRDLFGEARLDLNVALVSEVNHVLEYSGVAQIDVRFAGLGANMRGGASLRPALPWRTQLVGEAEAILAQPRRA
jgi:hypothetical protein